MDQPRLSDDFHFLRLGGKTYTLQETAIPTLQATIDAIKSVQEQRVQQFITTAQRATVEEAAQLSNNEHQRILTDLNSGSISVPANRHNLPFVVINAQVCPIKNVILTPNVFRSSLSGLRSHTNDPAKDKLREAHGTNFFDTYYDLATSTEVIIKLVNMPVAQSALFALTDSRIVMNVSCFHSLSRHSQGNGFVWYSLCIGNAQPRQFWNVSLNEFIANVNMINCDSPGSSSYAGLGISEWLLRSSIQSITCTPQAEGWLA